MIRTFLGGLKIWILLLFFFGIIIFSKVSSYRHLVMCSIKRHGNSYFNPDRRKDLLYNVLCHSVRAIFCMSVNGSWSSWGIWSDCSQSCGGGSQTRRRACTSPSPSNGGVGCPGRDVQNRSCNGNGCPGTICKTVKYSAFLNWFLNSKYGTVEWSICSNC